MSTGKKHHYFPATSISEFSFERSKSGPARNKRVYVKFLDSDKPIQKLAPSDILKKKNFYTISPSQYLEKDYVDQLWTSVEEDFSTALSELIITQNKKHIPINLYLYFIEYVSQLISRNPQYDISYKERLSGALGQNASESLGTIFNLKDNINLTRLIEIQRIRGLLLYASFSILHATEGSFINSDVGYSMAFWPKDLDNSLLPAIIIPLTPKLSIQFVINTDPKMYDIRKFQSQNGIVNITKYSLKSQHVTQTNTRIASLAKSLLFAKHIEDLKIDTAPTPQNMPAYAFDFILSFDDNLRSLARTHENDYWMLSNIAHYDSSSNHEK